MVGVFRRKVVVACSIMIFCTFISAARAGSDQNIATVDTQSLFERIEVMKAINAQVDEAESELQDLYSKKEEEILQKRNKLNEKKDLIKDEIYESEAQDLENKFIEFQRSVQKYESSLQKARFEALEQLNEKIRAIVKSMSEDRSFSLVLAEGVTLYSKYDITEDLINKVNKEIHSYKVSLPSIRDLEQ